MRYEAIGRLIRSLRQRRGWRQVDLSARARQPRTALIDLEAGRLGRLSVDALRDFADALDARLRIQLDTTVADPHLLLDAVHAFLQDRWAGWLSAWGWDPRVEVSFNHFGDRGRIDLIAFHPRAAALLIVEVKSALVDLQDLLGGLDVKVRIGPMVARTFGWAPTVVIPMLIVADSTTARRRLRDHTSLFTIFELRGRAATSWLGRPASRPPPTGILCTTRVPDVAYRDGKRLRRQRVRIPRTAPRSAARGGVAGSPAEHA